MSAHVDLGLARFAQEFLERLMKVRDLAELPSLLEAAARELGFLYYAMIHHDDHRKPKPSLIFIQNYPAGYADSYVENRLHRFDPVVELCHIIDRCFAWSELAERNLTAEQIDFLARGAREGVSDGITVPSYVLGERGGSCNFSGFRGIAGSSRDPASLRLIVQGIGSYAFQAARRITLGGRLRAVRAEGLSEQERECIILAGQGKSNTDIGVILGIPAGRVKFYIERACKRYDVHNRTQLTYAAVVDGEIGVHEMTPRKYRWLVE